MKPHREHGLCHATDQIIVPDQDEYGYDEIDGCLHGVPWDEDCWECQLEEDSLDGFGKQ